MLVPKNTSCTRPLLKKILARSVSGKKHATRRKKYVHARPEKKIPSTWMGCLYQVTPPPAFKVNWFPSKLELLATFKWKLLYISLIVVTEVLTGLSSRWSCGYKVCGQRNFTERKTTTVGGISVVCPDFFLTPSLILMLWACWLFHFFFCFVSGTRKETKTKRRSQEKAWAEKVSSNDFHLLDNFTARRAPVVKWQNWIHIFFCIFLVLLGCKGSQSQDSSLGNV